MTTALHTFCLAVGALILLYKVGQLLRGRRDLASVAFCCYVGFSALSYLVLLPPVYVRVDDLCGVPNMAGAISALCVMALTAAQQVLLMHWTYPASEAAGKAQRRVAFIALAVVAYVVTFLLNLPPERRFSDFYVHYTRHIFGAPYLAIYIIACTVGQVDVVRHCWRYANVANRSWLRRGMLTTTVGAATILVYCAIRIVDLAGGQLNIDLRRLEPAAWLCSDIGSAVALLGWILPTIGPRLSAAARWLDTYRCYNRFYPLWILLYRLEPGIALDPAPSRLRDRLRLRNLDFWLYRRVIEIKDGQRALRRYLDAVAGAPGPEAARGSGAHDRLAVAMQLDVMLRASEQAVAAKARGRTATSDVEVPPDFADEVKWLSEVARTVRGRRRRRRWVSRRSAGSYGAAS